MQNVENEPIGVRLQKYLAQKTKLLLDDNTKEKFVVKVLGLTGEEVSFELLEDSKLFGLEAGTTLWVDWDNIISVEPY